MRPLIDMKAEDIRPGIVPDHIQIVAGSDQLGSVEFSGEQSRLTFKRTGEHVAERTYDQATAPDERPIGSPMLDGDA